MSLFLVKEGMDLDMFKEDSDKTDYERQVEKANRLRQEQEANDEQAALVKELEDSARNAAATVGIAITTVTGVALAAVAFKNLINLK